MESKAARKTDKAGDVFIGQTISHYQTIVNRHFDRPRDYLKLARRMNASRAACGTTELPRHLIRSTRMGSPLTTRPTSGSIAHRFSAIVFSDPLSDCRSHRGLDLLPTLAESAIPGHIFLAFAVCVSRFSDCKGARSDPWSLPSLSPQLPVHWEWASIQIRSLRCGAPTSAADTIVHRASYPSALSSKRTRSSPRTARAGTFSRKTYLGRHSRTSRKTSNTRPLHPPAKPAPLPATLISWQGNPPLIMSISGSSSPLSVCTSSQIGA